MPVTGSLLYGLLPDFVNIHIELGEASGKVQYGFALPQDKVIVYLLDDKRVTHLYVQRVAYLLGDCDLPFWQDFHRLHVLLRWIRRCA
jgi:hypothetical protein